MLYLDYFMHILKRFEDMIFKEIYLRKIPRQLYI